MVDQLNSANSQPQLSATAANLRRLEALLTPGQPRTAQVVQVTPQPAQSTAAQTPPANTVQTPLANPQGSTQTPVQTQPTLQPTVQPAPPSGTSAQPGNNQGGANPSVPSAAATQALQPNTTATSYRVQIQLQGRLFELITQRPLEPGTQVQISRDGSSRISVQPVTQNTSASGTTQSTTSSTATTTSNPPPTAQASGNPNTTAAVARSAAPLVDTGQSGRSTQPQSSNTPTPSSPPTTATKGTATSGTTTSAAAPSSGRATSATTGVSQGAATSTPVTERVALQPLKGMPPIQAGQRTLAEVVSSRPLTHPAASNTTSTTSSTTASTTTANSAIRASASPGQPAAATSSTPAAAADQASAQLVRLKLTGEASASRIEMVSPRPLPAGAQVQLSSDSQGRIWAELPSAKTRAIEQALREHLPQQQSSAPLLNLLQSAQASGQLQQAKPMLLQLVQILLGRSLSSPQQTDAQSVKQQLHNSGTTLENKLARGDTQNLNLDHKALLLKVSQQLGAGTERELPATLSDRLNQLTQQALSRVLVNQLASLGAQPQEAGVEPNRTLALDIPVLWQDKAENLQLKIQRDDQGEDPETGERLYRWQVRLSFEIDEQRRLEAELTLEGERISVLWSGDAKLKRDVEAKLGDLQQRLESIGLEINTLGVRELLPSSDWSPRPPRDQLIDIQT